MSISDYQAIVTLQIDKRGLGDGIEGSFMLYKPSCSVFSQRPLMLKFSLGTVICAGSAVDTSVAGSFVLFSYCYSTVYAMYSWA
jgi:hypothetical protein